MDKDRTGHYVRRFKESGDVCSFVQSEQVRSLDTLQISDHSAFHVAGDVGGCDVAIHRQFGKVSC